MTIPDYVAIGVLIGLGAWAAARILPRGKLWPYVCHGTGKPPNANAVNRDKAAANERPSQTARL